MAMNIKNIDELLCDDGFLAWYFKTDQTKIVFWDNLVKNDPEQKKLVDEAVEILEAIKIKEGGTAIDTDKAESRLFERINQFNPRPTAQLVPLKGRRQLLRWVAAAIILVTVGFGLYKYFQPGKPVIETRYAEIRKESLPDGSQVTLNANSEVTYGKSWGKGKDREIWVKGEAFFQVEKTPKKSRFVVHTGHFDIIVTGTEFNVVNRNEKTNVLLKEGSVLIRASNGTETSMKPGDFVEFTNDRLQKKPAKDIQVLAWKDRKFIFEKTPMKEVGANIRELYGFNVRFENDAIATDTISGILPNDNLDIFLQLLETAKNYEIIKTDQDILIKTRRR
ncbi:FecR family protein [Terrimonas pollutisoli]|uniref:FecR family protein n=1 Tax=Terrimonas pollutisoli TaxID=3034147 RepID=UPI0023EDFCEB|nr:FecR domain-containing protein [Terrimonas sp. H1YJ31]